MPRKECFKLITYKTFKIQTYVKLTYWYIYSGKLAGWGEALGTEVPFVF